VEETTIQPGMKLGDVYTLEDLLGLVPEFLRPLIMKYGPLLLDMLYEEYLEWRALVDSDEHDAAYKQLVSGMDEDALLAEWERGNEEGRQLASENAKAIQMQKDIVVEIVKVLAGAAGLLVGL